MWAKFADLCRSKIQKDSSVSPDSPGVPFMTFTNLFVIQSAVFSFSIEVFDFDFTGSCAWACAAQPQQVETLHSRPQVAGGHEVFKKIWWYMIKIGLLYVALCQLVNFRLLFDSNLTIFDFLDQSHLITKRATKSTERQNILKPRQATYRFPYSASLCPVRLQHVVLHAAAIAFQWLHFQVQAKIPSHNVPFSYFASLWPRRQVNRVQLIQDDNHIKWHWICVYIYRDVCMYIIYYIIYIHTHRI